MPALHPVRLIEAKRDGQPLAAADIQALIQAYTAGQVPDYQMSAFLMAAFLQGLDEAETHALTDAMLHSGEVLDLSALPGTKVDKHSTGGVGDKVSLILAPIVAACGVPVPMISGRGLGHSGGTLDKLESIPGFQTQLGLDVYRRQLAAIGAVLIGQTEEIAPADRKLYALRDVTATVECIPFIAASIMSKKLAEGIDALVLDVKCGRGAFMKTEAEARRLAETLAAIGTQAGTPTVAWLTDMNTPLGTGIGNWPEVVESIRCLQGAQVDDLMTVTLTLAGEMLYLGGRADSWQAGRTLAEQAIADGRAFDKLVEITEAQGGDVSMLHNPEQRPGAAPVAEVVAPPEAEGHVADLDALALGWAAVDLGAGRRTKEDRVDPTAGITLCKKPGDSVQPGEVLALLHGRRAAEHEPLRHAVLQAFRFAEEPRPQRPRLLDRYADGQWQGGQGLS
ncbi:MAG: thymidine phosphorylase [Bacteroidota bacterium]